MLERDSAALSQRRAADGLLRGGLGPEEVGEAVRRTGARVVHAHNVNPTLGWRALAAAREAGARVVLHLHNYRLVCAVGTCFTRGEDCTRCHGRNTLPGRGAQLPRRLAGRVGRLRRLAGAVAGPDRRPGRPLPRPQRVRAAAPARSSARRSTTARAVLWSVQREFADALARRRRAARALRGPPEPREGRGRRRRRLPRRRPAARGGGRRPGRGRAAAARRGRRRALHRPRRRRTSSPRCAATPPSRSSPRATPRSCRSPRSRRWPPACRSSRSRSGGLAELVPEEGLFPPGDVARARRARAAPVGRRGGRRARAGGRARALRARAWWRARSRTRRYA